MPSSTQRPLREDLRRLARLVVVTGRRLVRPPSARAWVVPGCAALAAGLAYAWKWPVADFFMGHGGRVAGWVALAARAGASGVTILALGLAALVAGRARRRDALVDCALVLGAAGAWCWVLMRTGQLVLAEQRPAGGGEMRWFALDGHGVSGHAAVAALMLAPVRDVLARRLAMPVRRLVVAALVAWVAVVAWSRMWSGMHFLWNVVLGTAIGLVTGEAAVGAWRQLESDDEPRRRSG